MTAYGTTTITQEEREKKNTINHHFIDRFPQNPPVARFKSPCSLEGQMNHIRFNGKEDTSKFEAPERNEKDSFKFVRTTEGGKEKGESSTSLFYIDELSSTKLTHN